MCLHRVQHSSNCILSAGRSSCRTTMHRLWCRASGFPVDSSSSRRILSSHRWICCARLLFMRRIARLRGDCRIHRLNNCALGPLTAAACSATSPFLKPCGRQGVCPSIKLLTRGPLRQQAHPCPLDHYTSLQGSYSFLCHLSKYVLQAHSRCARACHPRFCHSGGD